MTQLATVNQVSVDDPVENDLQIVNGQLALIEGDAAIAQSLKARLSFFQGEWFLDTREGVPYFEEVFIKAPNLSALRGIFRRVLAGTPGVRGVESLALALDTGVRQLSISFVVILDSGAILRSEDFGPFIVEI